jgi:hypothetical protein
MQELTGARMPKAAQSPPVTKPRSLGVLKSVQSDWVDVKVEAEILADGSGSSAKTSFNPGAGWSAPGYSTDAAQKIVGFTGKFTWHATITLQTVYAAPGDASKVSCYGRGTTDEDVRDGNVTLGFHESCHRSDFTSFLTGNPLPDPPALKLAMSEKEYKKQIKVFDEKLKAFFRTMNDQSEAGTDEVGHPKSAWLKTGKCYRHLAP